jgi:hypothetical protein
MKADSTLSLKALLWLCLNSACNVVIPLVERKLMDNELQSYSPEYINYIRNISAIPLMAVSKHKKRCGMCLQSMILATARSEFQNFMAIDFNTSGVLLFSGFFGFSIGLAYYFLLKLVSPTSIVVANVGYKVVSSIIGFFLWTSIVPFWGWTSLTLCFVGVLLYTYFNQPPGFQILTFSKIGVIVPILITMFTVTAFVTNYHLNQYLVGNRSYFR